MSVVTQSRADYLQGIGKLAIDNGFVPLALKGKIPIGAGWQNFRNNEDKYRLARRVHHLVEKGVADNIGVLTGQASNIVVLDLDNKPVDYLPGSPNSIQIWSDFLQRNKGILETLIVKTGSGGFHYYFRYQPEKFNQLPNFTRVLGFPIDFKTNDAQVVFPGSRHPVTGQEYVIVSGYKPQEGKFIIADMPDYLYWILNANMNPNTEARIGVNI